MARPELPSTLERNRELRQLFMSLPVYYTRGFPSTDFLLIARIRKESGRDEILKARAQSLLRDAPITQVFRNLLIDYFGEMYIKGRHFGSQRPEFESFEEEVIKSAIDLDYHFSPGIFDPEKAGKIETETYKKMRRRMSDRLVEFGQHPEMLDVGEEYESIRLMLRKWRRQFRNMHGLAIEPE